MKNGLHSGSLNTRPLSHLYNQIMKLFIQQQVIFSSFAPLNGITFDVIIWLTWWNWIHWKIPKYITLNVLHYLRNIFECDPPASGTRRYKFHPIRSLPPIWKKIKIFHMDEGQLKNVCLSVCRQKERKKEKLIIRELPKLGVPFQTLPVIWKLIGRVSFGLQVS
jgi:hypothetical protein